MGEPTPEFLTLEDILEAHATSLERWGGQDGVRDLTALDSAVHQPQQTFDGEFLHGDIFEMAAAYAFHIGQSQAFLDGSKRTGVLAAITFLDLNGCRIPEKEDALYRAMIEVANRNMTKAQLAGLLRELADV